MVSRRSWFLIILMFSQLYVIFASPKFRRLLAIDDERTIDYYDELIVHVDRDFGTKRPITPRTTTAPTPIPPQSEHRRRRNYFFR